MRRSFSACDYNDMAVPSFILSGAPSNPLDLLQKFQLGLAAARLLATG